MQTSMRHIYVALKGHGPDHWRKVEAEVEGEDTYRITSVNEAPDEQWEYETGTVVRCRAATLPSGERVLVATERLQPGRIGIRPAPQPPPWSGHESRW